VWEYARIHIAVSSEGCGDEGGLQRGGSVGEVLGDWMTELFDGLFRSCGISTNPVDQRALSQEELLIMMGRQTYAMQQACRPASYIQALQQYQPPQRPLDDRFADFKVRLAAAIERRNHEIRFIK
jgi:hypothetical protein